MAETLQPLRLFLCHANGDKPAVRELYRRLRADGFDPWLDEENILPGNDWRRETAAAISKSDMVLVCLSRASVNKRGFAQREVKYALDTAEEQPEGSIFIIPLKLDECEVPGRLSHLHWVNLFESDGYEKLLASLRAKSGQAAPGAHAGLPPATEGGGSRHALGPLLRDMLKGLVFVAFVLALKLAVEQTAFGERFRSKVNDLLHRPLSSDDTPVSVVDMRDLGPAEFNVDGRTGTATPREPLRRMIEAVAEARPKAIGVLIDFSPDEQGYVHPRDPEFFQFCLDLRRQRGVPVFLGINRTLTRPPAEWLGDEDYQSLAANMLIPRDSRRMLTEIRMGGEGDPLESWPAAEGGASSKAMSVALAYAYERQSGQGQARPSAMMEGLRRAGFVETVSEKRVGPGLKVEEFSPDYSLLDSIEAVRTTDPAVLHYEARQFEGKVVLIGSGSLDRERDLFEVPGRDRKYPSIFLHAAAAYTLINPRYEVSGKGRLALDILLSLTLVAVIILARRYGPGEDAGAARRLRGFFTLAAAVAAVVAGVVFVRATRVMWDDFLAAPAVLAFHPSVERRLAALWKTLKRSAPSIRR
jgi:CHASE2 domain-containing sensor protein